MIRPATPAEVARTAAALEHQVRMEEHADLLYAGIEDLLQAYERERERLLETVSTADGAVPDPAERHILDEMDTLIGKTKALLATIDGDT